MEKIEFVKKVPKEYHCSLCSKLLNYPVLTDCCGQHFCEICLENWFASKQPKEFKNVWANGSYQKQEVKICPKCGVRDLKYISYVPIRRKIDNLSIYCPNRSEGCDSTALYGSYGEHIAVCMFQSTSCGQCAQTMLRKDIESHKENKCQYRQVKCSYCKLEGTYNDITTNVHHDKCPGFPLSCPNNCGESNIERKDISTHKQECPNEIVKCPFFEAGCCDVKRKDLKDHVSSSTGQHLDLVMKKAAKMQHQMDDLMTKTMVLEQKLNTVTSSLALEIKTLDVSATQYAQQPVQHAQAIKCMQAILAMAGKSLLPNNEKYHIRFTWDKQGDSSARTMPFYIDPGYKFYLRCKLVQGHNYKNEMKMKLILIQGEYDIKLEWPMSNIRNMKLCLMDSPTYSGHYGNVARSSASITICEKCNPTLMLALQEIEQPTSKSEHEIACVQFGQNQQVSPNDFYCIMHFEVCPH